ncbi:MAG: S8 family serine peptidase [Bacteroidales bacterium]|nr:S8 family serine peptidase [Bacteroidales bacterium]
MKKLFLTFIAIIMGFIGLAQNQAIGGLDKIKINIILKAQSDAVALNRMADVFSTKAERRDFVVNTLKHQAEESQADLINHLNDLKTNGLVEDIRPLWIVNSVSCYAEGWLVDELAKRDDVLAVYQVDEFQCVESEDVDASVERGDGREIAENVTKVNADQVWALGYTGEGVLIGLIDTGVRLDHADLQGNLWDGGAEYPNHGYDFYQHDNDPSDTHGHGTHVAGTIVGNGASGTQTGVAPDAKIMVLKVFHGEDNLTEPTMWVEAMQFAVEHGAEVLNMSLGQPMPSASIKLMMRQACDNTLASGVVAAICAGNFRQMSGLSPKPHNIWSPGDCPSPYLHEDQMVNPGGTSCVISVGAVDFNDAIASMSSFGPSTWTDVAQYNDYPYSSGSSTSIGLIRPDVCAPGVNVKSLDWSSTSGYCLKSGTSMATPCVAGTIALMLSKDHELTPERIDEILENTAVKLSVHKSNDFGSGRIDALAAVIAIDDDDVEEIDNDGFVIYPNPATDVVYIKNDDTETMCTSSLQMYSIDGKLIKNCVPNHNQIRIDDLEHGVYILKIETANGYHYKRILK